MSRQAKKHIECLTCGEVLSSAAIPQLVEKDRTDEDGNSKVGDFSILVTNANEKPIFDSEISIDINDNVTIKLPSGRLLDYADQTIITAINTDTQQPKSALQIFLFMTIITMLQRVKQMKTVSLKCRTTRHLPVITAAQSAKMMRIRKTHLS
ncbi:MAG: hypothetical protein L6V93_12835 [Clostridiales bacterium]|nr:MAG: hypothetical protein L6V93_12835 [Clostridiales bacterium]